MHGVVLLNARSFGARRSSFSVCCGRRGQAIDGVSAEHRSVGMGVTGLRRKGGAWPLLCSSFGVCKRRGGMVTADGGFVNAVWLCYTVATTINSYDVLYCMTEIKKKTSPGKRTPSRKAGHSPMPGSTCGHSGCEASCKVRYCGPTSHPMSHHAASAAFGVKQVWAASVIAGLAVVLTGFIAFSSAQAHEQQQADARSQIVRGDILRELNRINERLQTLEASVQALQQ